jgi:anti-sigma B factor antagonist
MEIYVRTVEDVLVVETVGELDAKTSPEAEEQILPLIRPGGRVILDMTQVTYISSAGLRMFLLLHRKVLSSEGRIALIGLSEEIRDTMDITGFLNHFTTYDTLERGLAAFAQ